MSPEEIEMDLLLLAIYKRYGHDFRCYAKASLIRRIQNYCQQENVKSHCQLIERLLYDNVAFNQFLLSLTVGVTDMFRDPSFYAAFREKVIPVLRTYPSFKIWHAGCSTGEEVYSMAILLKETGLLDRAVIYATDINTNSLEAAKKGFYEVSRIPKFAKNYYEAKGQREFTDYYDVHQNIAVMKQDLKNKMTFSHHHLHMDGSFGQMNVILCRNVMIYFDRDLQNKVLNLFAESLDPVGFLCVGAKETLSGMDVEKDYRMLANKEKIYQRVVQ